MPSRKSSPEPTDPLFAAVGERVVRLRGDRNLSAAELAGRAGMDANYLWRIESGRQNLSLRNVARLAKALGVTLSALLEGVDVADVPLSSRPYGKEAAANDGSPDASDDARA